ncbi:hypothetical protein [Fodinicola feengrottensis]|uniref:hypothetical protein n=1 Tax=Fodinicola feengrottensis TaxID=435914 RepID=UPI0013D5D815|nr:hypothetical protein [Fodinicola feengrottensis]
MPTRLPLGTAVHGRLMRRRQDSDDWYAGMEEPHPTNRMRQVRVRQPLRQRAPRRTQGRDWTG